MVPPASPSTFPLGAGVTIDDLTADPYPVLANLRANEPVSWVPALDAWFITRRDLAIIAMRDAETFTVDDPRFTTAAILGDSMLNKDGAEHQRHRSPFTSAFRVPVLREKFDDFLAAQSNSLIESFAERGEAELRTELAGPLAVNTITEFLGLQDVTAEEVLSWYTRIAEAIVDLTLGGDVSDANRLAVDEVYRRVSQSLATSDDSLLHDIRDQALLRPEEVTPAAVVIMFGAIETAEGMTANALWHLLSHPEALARVRADRTLVGAVVEESLRMEPAAAVVDRYTTTDVEIGGVTIPAGDLVTISLLGANRDPENFEQPDDFNIDRTNSRQHVTFVQGPHGCLGLHLTRMETHAAINALLDRFDNIDLDESQTDAPSGLIFRKPARLTVSFS